jgi:hypothetical protein
MAEKEPESPFIKLATAIAVAAGFIFFFASQTGRDALWPAAAAIGVICLMGVGIAYFISKPR